MLKFGSKTELNAVYKCTVRLLDDTEVIECEFQPHHKGSYLLDYVCKQLNLQESDYFGLRYVDPTKQRHWLDLGKLLLKQVKELDPVLFSFRVKFYPPDPFKLKEEITRYQIYLQLKRDLLHGRLYCNQSEGSLLGAYILQSEFGDYDPEEHVGNYASNLKILLKQTQPVEEKMIQIHQTQLKSQTPADIETLFLTKACQLDTYGVDPHPVKDHRGNTLYLGVNHLGILTFQGSRKTHHFHWSEVQKINYEGKMFIVHLVYHEKKHTVGFKCPSGAACRHVWRCAIEQMLFFTLPKSKDAPIVTGGGLFSRGSKFRYSGRTEREVLSDDAPPREEPQVRRTSSMRRKASSVPATPSTPLPSDLGYCSLPRSTHSVPDSRLGGAHSLLVAADSPLTPRYAPAHDTCLLDPVSEESATRTSLHSPQALESVSLADDQRGDHKRDDGKERLKNGELLRPNRPRAPGLKEMDSLDDYYFRDSFDHSSSESQIIERSGGGISHRSSRSQTPQPPVPMALRGRSGSRTSVNTAPSGHVLPASLTPAPPNQAVVIAKPLPRRFNLFQVFVPSFLIVAATLVLATIYVMESEADTNWVAGFRRLPEMVALRREFYEPAKEFIAKRLRPLWVQ